ncbi:MAG: hypothetical protein H6738_20860 [Alphaproteobacteria bacterium]|nr:hypothetical protein [Alphaproteobacteria bacterium]MCB9699244.1 hypothetical protein [Alphaproteobacteria bacterium]
MPDVPVSAGELCDRLAILVIKSARIGDPGRRRQARALLTTLDARWSEAGLPVRDTLPEWSGLLEVNGALWDVEDALRTHEAHGDFGERFVELARAVYRLNDERARLKAAVDVRCGDAGTEPKWYATPNDVLRPPGGVTDDPTSGGTP